MHRFARVLSALSLSLVFASPSPPSYAAAAPSSKNILVAHQAADVIVLAHRGCWHEAPEVSLGAIDACKLLGVDAVEIDVRRSSDGVLVLMHDDRVDRTTNGTGTISEMTITDIRRLRLRAGAGGPDAPMTDEHVPTLEEALLAARSNLLVNVHLKAPVEREVSALVSRLNMAGQVTTWVTAAPGEHALMTSPLRGQIGIIPTVNDCALGYPAPCWPNDFNALQRFMPTRPVAFFFDYRQSYDFIRRIANEPRPAGTRIFVETLNRVDKLPLDQRRAEWRRLIDAGVSMIMTDQPADLVDFLRIVRRPSLPARK